MLDIQIDDDYRQDPVSFLTYYALFALAAGAAAIWGKLMVQNKQYLARAHILMLAYAIAYSLYLLLMGIVHSPGVNPEKDSLIISFVVLDLCDGTLSNICLAALFIGWSLPPPILSRQETLMIFIPWVTFISCSFVTYICFLIEATATFASYNSLGYVSITFVHNAAILGAIISLLIFCNVLCVTRRRVQEGSNQARKVVLQLPRMWALYVLASTLAQMITAYAPAWSSALGKHGVRMAFNFKIGSLLYPAPYLVYSELAPEGTEIPSMADEEEGSRPRSPRLAPPRPPVIPSGPAGGAGRPVPMPVPEPSFSIADEEEAAERAAPAPSPVRPLKNYPGQTRLARSPAPPAAEPAPPPAAPPAPSPAADGWGAFEDGEASPRAAKAPSPAPAGWDASQEPLPAAGPAASSNPWGDDGAEEGEDGEWGAWGAAEAPAAAAAEPEPKPQTELKRMAGKKD